MVRTMRARLSCGGPLASRRLPFIEPLPFKPVRPSRPAILRHRSHPECDYCNHKYNYTPPEPVSKRHVMPLPGAVGGPSVEPGGVCFCYGCSNLHYNPDPLCAGDKEARQARIVEYLASLR